MPPATQSLRRDLRSVFTEGVLWSLMVGMGETWFPAFALAVGSSEVWAGLLATVPILVGAVLQLLGPWGVAKLGSRRRTTMVAASFQVASFLPLMAGAAWGGLPGPVILIAASLYWGGGLAAGTVWNAWMTQVVPHPVRGRFFARRSGAAQIGVLLGLIAGGVGLHAAAEGGRVLWGFLGLFAAAALCRLSSTWFLSRIGEDPAVSRRDRIVNGRELLRRMRAGGDGRLILFLIVMTGAVSVASPFFTPYMLGPLHFTYPQFMALVGASFLAKAGALAVLGGWARRFGAGRLLRWASVLVALVPLLWLPSQSFWVLLAVQFVSGAMWAAHEFAAFLLYLDSMKEHERTSLLTALNLANAVAMVAGSLLGGAILSGMDERPGGYAVLFVVSTAVRLGATLLLVGMPVRSVDVPRVVFRMVSLRPSAGAIMRPLWASLRFPHRRRGSSGDRDPNAKP